LSVGVAGFSHLKQRKPFRSPGDFAMICIAAFRSAELTVMGDATGSAPARVVMSMVGAAIVIGLKREVKLSELIDPTNSLYFNFLLSINKKLLAT
jgi:hypothetical protein